MDSECYYPDGEPKDSVDQDTGCIRMDLTIFGQATVIPLESPVEIRARHVAPDIKRLQHIPDPGRC